MVKKYMLLAILVVNAQLYSNNTFTAAEINKIVSSELGSLDDPSRFKLESLTNATSYAIESSPLTVTGVSFCIDPNFAFFFDNQNPSFNITYKSEYGIEKTKHFQASINSIGIKFEFCLKFNLVLILGTKSDFYENNDRIKLGIGIDFGLPLPLGASIVYAPFANTSGGLLLLQGSLGPSGGLNIVIGGSLKPENFY